VERDGVTEEGFSITKAGRTAASKAPAEARNSNTLTHTPIPAAGKTFTKEYKGKTIKVAVTKDGFKWNGKDYTSLTALAMAVRGNDTAVNGRLFFGFAKPKAKAKDAE
jgi:hypothetical protein